MTSSPHSFLWKNKLSSKKSTIISTLFIIGILNFGVISVVSEIS